MAPRALLIGCSLLASALGVSAAAAAAAKAACSAAEDAKNDEACSMLQVKAASNPCHVEASSQNKSRIEESVGFVLPLHVRRGGSCKSQVAEVAMYIKMRTLAVQPSEFKLLRLDTGSSILAFCPPPQSSSIVPDIEVAFCAQYSPGTAWWGYLYDKPLIVDAGRGESFQVPRGVSYSIMSQSKKMGCDAGEFSIGGIFGISFKSLESLNTIQGPSNCLPTANTPASGYCSPDCFFPGPDNVPVINNFFNVLGHQKSLGIYWNGELGDEAARMYVDDKAFDNPHYNANNRDTGMYAFLGDDGYYSFRAVSIELLDKTRDADPSFTLPMEGECEKTVGACVMDTGTPGISLPTEIFQKYVSASMHARLIITLQGFGNLPNPVLNFYKSELEAQKMYGPTPFGAVMPGGAKGKFGSFVLGLATWASYYTVFTLSSPSSTIFVPHRFCFPSEPESCPGTYASTFTCEGRGGFQCCPPNRESFGQSFPCPSTPAGHDCRPAQAGGTFHGKLSNCLVPALACDEGQPR